MPGLPRPPSRRQARRYACEDCGRAYGGGRGYLDLRPREAFDEQTKYLDEALHADARHESIAPPLLGSKIRNDMLRAFSSPATAIASSISAAAAAARSPGTPDSGAALTGIDIAPYFAPEADRASRPAAGRPAPAAAARRRVHQGVVARRARTPVAPGARSAMLREANRVLADGGALFVYTHVAQERLDRRRHAARSTGSRRSASGWACSTCARSGCASRITSIRWPITTICARAAAECGFRIERITYYTPIVGAFVENMLVRMAEKALARRRQARAAGAAGRQRPDVTHGRRPCGAPGGRAGARQARRLAVWRARACVSWVMKLDIVLLRPHALGPVLRAAAQDRARRLPEGARVGQHGEPMRSLRILYAALDQTVPGTLGGSVHVAGGRRGTGGARPRRPRRRQPGGAWPTGRPVSLARDGAAARAARSCAGSRAAAIAALAREMRADVIIERYYNFGGEGVLRGARLGIPAVLEVNAPDRRLLPDRPSARSIARCSSSRCAGGANGCAG